MIAPGDLVIRSAVGIGTLQLLRRPERVDSAMDVQGSITGTLRKDDVGLIVSVSTSGDWALVISHDGAGWCRPNMLEWVS